MQTLSRWVLTFVLNGLWQAPLTASVAALGAYWMRRGPARYRYDLWVAALATALLLPVLSLRKPLPLSMGAAVDQMPMAFADAARAALPHNTEGGSDGIAGHPASWKWRFRAESLWRQFQRRAVTVYTPRGLPTLALVCYGILLLVRISRLALAWKRAARIRRASVVVPLPEWMQSTVARCKASFEVGDIPILATELVRSPLTLGVRQPAIILPASLLDPAHELDLTATLCHEMAHVRRRDFAVNLGLELLHLPLAFHPAARWIKRQIEETRELTCDEMAAGQFLSPQTYARSLVRMAKDSILTPTRAHPGHSLGIFNANILEERVMRILDSRPRASARLAILMALACGLLLAVTCMAASLLSLRPEETRPPASAAPLSPTAFVGIWTSSFQGKPFLTLRLGREGQTWTGSLSPFDIDINKDGTLTRASAGEAGGWKVVDASLKANILTIHLQDIGDNSRDDFELQTTGNGHGKFKPTGLPAKPWDIERVSTASAPTQSSSLSGVPGGIGGGVVGGVGGVGPITGVVGGVPGGVPGGAQAKGSSAAAEASFRGTIFDPSGARVPDAVVTISNDDAGKTLQTKTNQTGKFSFTGLSAGGYSVEVQKPGFADYHQEKLELRPKMEGVLDLELQPGEVVQNVDVTAFAVASAPKPQEPKRPQRIRVGGLIEAPKLEHMVRPAYPEEARKRGAQGSVLLQAVISMKGEPLSLKVISSPDPALSQAALDAVQQWRYLPTLLNGEPIEVVTTIAVGFHLVQPSAPTAP